MISQPLDPMEETGKSAHSGNCVPPPSDPPAGEQPSGLAGEPPPGGIRLPLRYVRLHLRYVRVPPRYARMHLRYARLPLKYVRLPLRYARMHLRYARLPPRGNHMDLESHPYSRVRAGTGGLASLRNRLRGLL